MSGILNFIVDEIKEARVRQEKRAESRRAAAAAEAEKDRLAKERERIAKERKVIEAAKAKALADREERLRSFILREAPALWRTYQDLGAQLANQERQIEDLRRTLLDFEKDPEQDPEAKSVLRKKIEDVYFACLKFEALPSREESDELRRRILEDGIQEATSVARRFNIMREKK